MSPPTDARAPAPRILIVDDARDGRELMEVVLEWEGFRTLTAGSGEEALAGLLDNPPDLVLLDLVLPGLGGCEVAAQIKANPSTKHIPIMILSGMSDSATKQRALGAGADDFITKPVERAELCQRIRSLLRSTRLAAGAPSDGSDARAPEPPGDPGIYGDC